MVWQHMPEVPRPPLRKDYGTKGRPIKLQSNYFPVTVKNPNIKLVHYDVTIKEGDKDVQLPKKKKMLIFEKMRTTYYHVFKNVGLAFDSEKNAYSINPIPQFETDICTKFEVDISEESGRVSKFNVKLEIVQRANLQDFMQALKYKPGKKQKIIPQNITQMLEVMFGHNSSLRFVKVGRNSFFPMEGEFGMPYYIGGGKEGVTGFFSSLRPAAWKDGSLLLNIDVANTSFYKEQPLLDFLMDTLRLQERDLNQTLKPFHKKSLKKELKNLKIQVTHSPIPRTYRVRDIGELGADRQTFTLTNPETNKEEKCTVMNYFSMRYHMRLRFPRLNCLMVGPQNRNIYVPMEVCKIVKGQRVQKKLNDYETAQLIRTASKPPYERLNTIRNIVRTTNFSKDPLIRALEFSISDQPISFEGRVLSAPDVLLNKEQKPKFGVWDIRDHSFFNGGKLKSWAVLNYDPRMINERTLNDFLFALQKMGKERGMVIERPAGIRNIWQPSPEVDILDVKKRVPNVQLIFVVLPRDGDIYARVKKTGDREAGVVTQCIKNQNVSKCAPSTIGNLLLKINAKIGGTNNILGQRSRPFVFEKAVLIMGADVNHPPSGDTMTPSVAAVVGSIDLFASQYAVEVRHQKHRTERIKDLKDMTKNLLKTYYTSTKFKPERIVMYRDGVSDSQFLEVLVYEMKAMRQACTELERDYKPAITFLVVQKRHHTRLFCQEREGVGRSKNIPPGTTVDTTITHPSERNFYLCSHQGIQGTSRPTHYHVLWDDSDLTMDMLEELTYAMCHLYSRCTRSVSIPTPAYYAHLAAYRGKVHIHELCCSETSSQASGGGSGPSDDVLAKAIKVERGQDIQSKLYYV